MSIVEIVGYLASLLLIISLFMKSILRLRIFNFLGSLAFVIYAAALNQPPVWIANGILCIINIYFISRALFRAGNNFKLIRCSRNDALVDAFVDYHQKDIAKFLPDFNWKAVPDDAVCFCLMRNMNIAGIWVAQLRDSYTYEVMLDYVTDAYRDYKSGRHLYADNNNHLKNLGIHYLVSDRHSDAHSKYLKKVGFEYREKDRLFKLKVQ